MTRLYLVRKGLVGVAPCSAAEGVKRHRAEAKSNVRFATIEWADEILGDCC